jgi:hypothetical protein
MTIQSGTRDVPAICAKTVDEPEVDTVRKKNAIDVSAPA